LITLVTFKWSFSCMSTFMGSKFAFFTECFVALVTHKWFFSRVNKLMGS
jgi:hypothetical protein